MILGSVYRVRFVLWSSCGELSSGCFLSFQLNQSRSSEPRHYGPGRTNAAWVRPLASAGGEAGGPASRVHGGLLGGLLGGGRDVGCISRGEGDPPPSILSPPLWQEGAAGPLLLLGTDPSAALGMTAGEGGSAASYLRRACRDMPALQMGGGRDARCDSGGERGGGRKVWCLLRGEGAAPPLPSMLPSPCRILPPVALRFFPLLLSILRRPVARRRTAVRLAPRLFPRASWGGAVAPLERGTRQRWVGRSLWPAGPGPRGRPRVMAEAEARAAIGRQETAGRDIQVGREGGAMDLRTLKQRVQGVSALSGTP